MAVPAMPEPVSVANIVPPPTAIMLSRPGTRPNQESSTSICFEAIPDLNITSPMRMNRGTGRMEKCATEALTESTSWLKPAKPFQNRKTPTTLMPRKAKATGTPIASRTTRAPKMRSSTIHHSGISHSSR